MEGVPKKFMLKLILLGDANVGKTSLMQQFVNEKYSQSYKATIGADFLIKQIDYGNKNVTLQIWDTAGQEQFQSLGASFYRGADACILVYDIADSKTFERMMVWKDDFIHKCGPKDPDNFPFMVLGNKIDKEGERKIGRGKAEQWCKLHNEIPFYETSAKTRTNVNEAFMAIAAIAMERNRNSEIFIPEKIGTKLNEKDLSKKAKKESKCC